MITTIIRPKHEPVDACDRERVLIGLLIDKHSLPHDTRIVITGIRNALVYHAPGKDWSSLKTTRLMNGEQWRIDVRWHKGEA